MDEKMRKTIKGTFIAICASLAICTMPCAAMNPSSAWANDDKPSKSLSKRSARVAWKLLDKLGVGQDGANHTVVYNVEVTCSGEYDGCWGRAGGRSGSWSAKDSKKWTRLFTKLKINSCSASDDHSDGSCYYEANVFCMKERRSRTPDCTISGDFEK